MGSGEFVAVNIPKKLLDRLEALYENTNESGYTYIASRAEGVRRAVEHYIKLLDTFLQAKTNEKFDLEGL